MKNYLHDIAYMIFSCQVINDMKIKYQEPETNEARQYGWR